MGMLLMVRRLLSLVYLITHPAVPLRLKGLPVFAAAYFIWPRDLWFDYRPFGFVDDLVIGLILIAIFTAKAWPYVIKADHRKEELKKDSVKVHYQVIEDDAAEPASKSKPS